jgi:hypothetical protein
MRRRLFVAFVTASLVAGACTSVSGLSGGQDGGTPADAATADADASPDALPPDASAGDGDAGPVNLLTNPGFENSLGSGCTSWSTVGTTTAVLSDVARTGSHSCLVCPSDATTQYFGIAQYGVKVDAAASYYGELWVHAPPTEPVAGYCGVVITETLPDGGLAAHQGSFATPGATWSLSSVTATVTPGDKIEFEVHGFYPDGGCTLVDDLALYAQ